MFGSDWPVCRLSKGTDYKDVLKLLQEATKDLSATEKQAIFHDTVCSFYDL